MTSSCIWMFSNTSVNTSSDDVFCWQSLQDSELRRYLMMLFQYRFFSWIYHAYLAEDTAGSWVLFPPLSLLSFSLSSTDFKERFLNFRSLDLDFFSLRSSGVFLSEVRPFVSRSELMPTSPVWDRCVAEMWDVRCEMWDVRCEMWDVNVGCEMWDVRCEMWDVRCEVWDVRCEMWDARCEDRDETGRGYALLCIWLTERSYTTRLRCSSC